MPSRARFRRIVKDAHDRFVYVTDEEQYGVREDWRIPELAEDGKLRGDCDDFALYVFDKGREAGLQMRLITCRVPVRGGWSGHAVAYCEDFNLVGDNMHNHAYQPGWANVRWDRMSGINNLAKRHWRQAKLT